MLRENAPASRMQSCESAPWSMQTRTRGGCSDSDATALAVRPQGEPSAARAATTDTPVTQWPRIRRNSEESIGIRLADWWPSDTNPKLTVPVKADPT